ncbi:hypothetical protein IL306_006859 [Fusarium sp. DS 682]|nr:hypothetical protein IL306_006859 [Fusarium sp. DS 682]
MEVLGAVASCIAVVQALAAGKHAVSLFREIPDIQKDFDYLMKELDMIKSMAQAVSRMAPTTTEQNLINNAARNLNEITAELEELLRTCSRETGPEGSKRNKTRKRKWLVEKSDIKKLQQRMNQAKETLHFALNSSRASKDIQRSVAEEGAYPHDTDINGIGLIEYALAQRLYSSLEVLLDIWKTILSEVGLPRGAAFSAADLLRNCKLDDKKTYLVQKALSFSRDPSEVAATKVYEAILQRRDLQEALQEQPWAIDTLGETGETPLLVAARLSQLRSMEALISAGADVNQQSYNGLTPLMAAVRREDVESVKLLLKFKCDVDMCNREGTTALQLASRNANPELISLLLAAGASAKQSDFYGDTALHDLAKYADATSSQEDIKAVIELLLMAGSELEARNKYGRTPFLESISFDNFEVTRGLLNADCSVNLSDCISQNLLHLASAQASLQLLQYLSALDLSGINPYEEDSCGDTPWDDFVYNRSSDEWYLGDARKPSFAEQEAFVELYQGVRDQALQHDIQNLEQILGALQTQDVAVARERLAVLIEKEKTWERENLVCWYRAVDKRVQHAEWELATDDVEGHIQDLQEELETPVWKIPSKRGYLWEFSDEESVSEEGSDSEDESEKSTYSDQQVGGETDV